MSIANILRFTSSTEEELENKIRWEEIDRIYLSLAQEGQGQTEHWETKKTNIADYFAIRNQFQVLDDLRRQGFKTGPLALNFAMEEDDHELAQILLEDHAEHLTAFSDLSLSRDLHNDPIIIHLLYKVYLDQICSYYLTILPARM